MRKIFLLVTTWVCLQAGLRASPVSELAQYMERKEQQESQNVCLTRGCAAAASEILQSIDTTADPCEDFYQFACGNAIKEIGVLPEDKQYIDVFSVIQDKVKKQLRTALESPDAPNDSKSTILAKTFYKSCLNHNLIEKIGLRDIKKLVKEVGGWPVLEGDAWQDDNVTWTSLMRSFRQKGFETGYFLQFAVTTDSKNSSTRSIELDQPSGFGLPREFLEAEEFFDPYYEYMVDAAVELGADKERAKKELHESLQFEIALAKIALPQEERQNYTLLYNPIKIEDLELAYPETPWLEHINNMLPERVHVGPSYIVVNVAPKYIDAAMELIRKTPKRVLANYAIWRVVQDHVIYLSDDLYRHYTKAVLAITGQAKREERWQECVKETYEDLKYAVASMYVRQYFDEEAKRRAEELVDYIRQVFDDILRDVDWMDELTRQRALTKAEKVGQHIAYPVEELDDNILDEHYKGLTVDEDQYLYSSLNISKHSTDFGTGRLFEPVNRSDWRSYGEAYDVGAYYLPSANSIQLPAGILQGTFFNKERPAYLNFGAIGSIIGHELTHGFDDKGSQLDDDGNLENWWDGNTEQRFLDKTQCFVEQYGNFSVKEINDTINGVVTLGENIADNAGIKEAYAAYKKWEKDHHIELPLPGLNYTPYQLFWVSAAKNWCTKYSPYYLKAVVKTDSHSPNSFRVLGPFSNFEQFAADFYCPKGSSYNPTHRCSVW